MFLHFAMDLANLLDTIHKEGIIVRDLSLSDISFSSVENKTTINQLYLSTKASGHQVSKMSFQPREEAYPYLSPEQTGRINRTVDHRTDLYSIGIIYYEMLTGKLPFHAKDPLEWIHCHVARIPSFPSEAMATIPGMIRSIILKLLSKEPDERYQTLRGLISDLDHCLSQLNQKGRIDSFALAEKDFTEKFGLPQKFYGHKKELKLLDQAFHQVEHTGVPELIFIAGEPGVGKSRIANELRQRVVKAGGFFANAKPDQYKVDMPYSTVSSAFSELVSELLTYGDQEIKLWRKAFHSSLGMNAQLISEIVPQFKLIYSTQIPLPKLLPSEEGARFVTACKQFLRVFAKSDRPLILFFDDLQWADSSSFKLIGNIFSNFDLPHVFTIGAFRQHEAQRNPSLLQLLKDLREAEPPPRFIELRPLTQRDFDQFIGDAFQRKGSEIRKVGELIYQKTAGNPFFARQFLSNLAHERIIYFSPEKGGWNCDVNKIRERKFTDNVVDFMVARLRSLSPLTQNILRLAAGIGHASDVETICTLTNLGPGEIHRALADAVEVGMVFRDEEQYRFLHDRIQEAAYSFIPEGERGRLHLLIGRALLEQTPEAEVESRTFEILNQFEKGLPLIVDPRERIEIAGLQLIAARKAKSATAYASALRYVVTGIDLCAKVPGSFHEGLQFALGLEQAECEYLLGEYQVAEEHCQSLLPLAQTKRDMVSVYLVEISLFEIQGQFEKGVDSLIKCLQLYDIPISAHPTMEQVQAAYDGIWEKLGDRKIGDLVNLPVIEDPELLTVLTALSHNICSYFTDEKLFFFQGAYIVNFSLQYGNSAPAVSGYGMIALYLGPMFGKYREAYEFGKLACRLVEVHGFESARAMALDEFGAFVNYWISPLATGLTYIRQANEQALKLGQMNWFCYSSFDILCARLFKGDPLTDVLHESEGIEKRIRALGQTSLHSLVIFLRGFILQMTGATPSFSSFTSPEFDQAQFEQEVLPRNPDLVKCWYYCFQLEARIFAGDFVGALSVAKMMEKILWSTPGQYTFPEYHFCLALTLTQLHRESSADKQKEATGTLTQLHEKLQTWATNCPQNFQHKYALVSAEISRIQDRTEEAMHFYEEAITSARQNDFLQYEALAYELAAKFYGGKGFCSVSAVYMSKARSCYERWGALGKVKQLEQMVPHLIEGQSGVSNKLSARGLQSEKLDLISAVKASQAVSTSIEIEKLIQTLLQVILEQSGGQKVILLLKNQDRCLRIAAEAFVHQSSFQLQMGKMEVASRAKCLPQSIINYVSKTLEYVLLNEAHLENKLFSNDPYFLHAKSKSVLCMPILRQQAIVGLIYLENNVTSHAFSLENLTVLELLAAQAAISLQNVNLYENLRRENTKRKMAQIKEKRARIEAEKSVTLRDDFLAIASHELRTPLTPLNIYLNALNRQLRNIAPGVFPKVDVLLNGIKKTEFKLREMNKLIDNFLDVSLIRAGRLILERESFDLVQLVQKVVHALKNELEEVKCSTELDAATDIFVFGDPFRIEQVVTHILTNAIKFGRGRPIQIRIWSQGLYEFISIIDHGIGIEQANLPHIFKPFERASSVMKFPGFGIGLFIAQQIVVAHGGTIEVTSEVGRGSIFTIKLPRGHG